MTKKVLWQELRRIEFEEAVKADAVVIIPVASTEQHGDHLPVNTDAYQCFTIAQRAAQAIDEFPVLVLPAIWTGYSAMHMAYPGTITLKWQTLVDVLTQIASSVHAHGFRKLLILNGHGGNTSIVSGMRGKLSAEDHISSVLVCTWWDIPSVVEVMKSISDSDKGCLAHAAEMETSIQLYLQPELVDKDAAKWARGVYGDPTTATHEKGERLINAAVDAVVKILRDFHSGKLNPVSGREVFEGQKAIE